jgi:hypothetical protein
MNVLRSALSSTHPRIDGYLVGQHPYVVILMRGVLNNRPPKPRSLTFTLLTTKTTRSDETVSAFYTCFPDDKRLCLIASFQQYISMTVEFRRIMKDQPNKLFLSFQLNLTATILL